MQKLYGGIAFTHTNPDFNKIWVAVGCLDSLGIELVALEEIPQHQLGSTLTAFQPAVIGMSFPFSLPIGFIEFWCERIHADLPHTWQGVVQMVITTTYERLAALAGEYGQQPPRLTDERFKKILQSPLYTGGPNLLRGTFQGMRILAALNPAKFSILPFDNAADRTAVIETTSRPTLHSLGFASAPYRSVAKKEPEKIAQNRHELLTDLISFRERRGRESAILPRLSIHNKFAFALKSSPDAIDSLISMYTSLLWARESNFFDDPFAGDDTRVLLEGWSYVPLRYAAVLTPP